MSAHELSSWLFDHAHIAGSAPGWRLDHNAGTAALLFSCLAIGSLLALLRVPAPASRPRSMATVRVPLLLSIGAFVGTDFAERFIAGQHGLPPVLVLLIGAGVYGLIGTAFSVLWRCFDGLALRSLSPADDAPQRLAARRPVAGARLEGFPSRHWTPVSAGRAPPLAAC